MVKSAEQHHVTVWANSHFKAIVNVGAAHIKSPQVVAIRIVLGHINVVGTAGRKVGRAGSGIKIGRTAKGAAQVHGAIGQHLKVVAKVVVVATNAVHPQKVAQRIVLGHVHIGAANGGNGAVAVAGVKIHRVVIAAYNVYIAVLVYPNVGSNFTGRTAHVFGP